MARYGPTLPIFAKLPLGRAIDGSSSYKTPTIVPPSQANPWKGCNSRQAYWPIARQQGPQMRLLHASAPRVSFPPEYIHLQYPLSSGSDPTRHMTGCGHVLRSISLSPNRALGQKSEPHTSKEVIVGAPFSPFVISIYATEFYAGHFYFTRRYRRIIVLGSGSPCATASDS